MNRFDSSCVRWLQVVLLSGIVLASAPSCSDANPSKISGPVRVSVLGLSDALTDRILQSLANSRRFVPVEREALRKVVEEQRFGKQRSDDFVTRTLDEAIGDIDDVNGFTVQAIGALAKFKDADNDLKDLGTAVGADFLVVAKLEKLQNRKAKTTAVPYSREGRANTIEVSDGRLLFRVVRIESGEVIGAGSIRSRLTENVYAGVQTETDDFSFLDQLAQEATARIIDVTFPATIVSVEPLVISRGTNDGVRPGDRYVVKREGKEVMDNGVSLGRLLSEVGSLELSEVNETMSVARVTGGSAFAMGDLAIIDSPAHDRAADAASVAASASQAGRPLSGRSARPKDLPRIAMGSIKFGATGDQSAAMVTQFTDRIISGLAATKRFQMIDRQEVDQLLREQEAQAIAGKRGMASGMGTLAGADYLVYGNVSLFDLQGESTQLPGSTRTFSQRVGRVDGTIRIVDARSGEILDSRSVGVKKSIDPNASKDRAVTTLANAYSDELVAILLNAIYPIKVAAIAADGTVYINRGLDGGITRGESLQAFRPGEAIIDPDTGIELGVQETLIGGVSVAVVEDARSRGAATPGSGLEVGDILRRSETEARPATTSRGQMPARGQGKPTLAVGAIRVGGSSRVQSTQRSYVQGLAGILGARLSQTNRFEILERKEIDQLLDEKMFQATSSGGDISAYLKDLSGADYMVYGELTDFRIETRSKNIELLDEVQKRTSGVARLLLRVVDVRAGSVLAAEQISIDQRLANDADGGDLVELIAVSAVKLILERVYPMRVIGMLPDQSTVYLNRGEDGDLQVGTVLDLMRPGPEMIDPDTGQSFGRVEEKVATVRIVSVEASRSRAELVSGGTPAVGDIGRSTPAPEKKHVVKKEKRAINRPAF